MITPIRYSVDIRNINIILAFAKSNEFETGFIIKIKASIFLCNSPSCIKLILVLRFWGVNILLIHLNENSRFLNFASDSRSLARIRRITSRTEIKKDSIILINIVNDFCCDFCRMHHANRTFFNDIKKRNKNKDEWLN